MPTSSGFGRGFNAKYYRDGEIETANNNEIQVYEVPTGSKRTSRVQPVPSILRTEDNDVKNHVYEEYETSGATNTNLHYLQPERKIEEKVIIVKPTKIQNYPTHSAYLIEQQPKMRRLEQVNYVENAPRRSKIKRCCKSVSCKPKPRG